MMGEEVELVQDKENWAAAATVAWWQTRKTQTNVTHFQHDTVPLKTSDQPNIYLVDRNT